MGSECFYAALANTKDQWADAVGVTEANQSKSIDHVQSCVSPLASVHDGFHGLEDHVVHGSLVCLFGLEFVGQGLGKDVQEDFRVAVGVDVAEVGVLEGALEFVSVGQVSVVSDADAEGVVGGEGLRLFVGGGAGGGVANVSDANVASEFLHVRLLKDVPHQAVVLSESQAAVFYRHHARRVLSSMLQHRQAVEQQLVHVLFLVGEEHPDDSCCLCLWMT
mmetsp:Transcript_26218/g.43046  ORF Transcript_26218/g.43046 Transcript_26218/m.43046 type:complete len:220 (+) Transcript_26218:120-779(+)